jgi:hypothetical protein
MTKSDVIILACAAALLAGLYGKFWSGHGAPAYARIIVGDKQQALVALDQDKTLSIKGELGVSTVEIHAGKVRFSASPCTGKQCIHSGWAGHAGEFIACLPNRVSVSVIGKNQYFDSINF